MRGFRARTLAVGMAVLSALALTTMSASLASASSRVDGFSSEVGSLKVQIYSQMCDNNGPNLHTRLAVRNTSRSSQSILVHDAFAIAVYDPPGPIAAGKGQLVHLTSSNRTPQHTLTVTSAGQTKTMTVPESPCSSTTTTTTGGGGTTTTTKSHGTTTTSGDPGTSTTTTTKVGPAGGGGGNPGGPTVVSPGVVTVAAKTTTPAAVKAATTAATLPFTGSDIRGFAIIGNLLVLIGFGLLLLSHRSPRAAAFFQRLRPGSSTAT
jgi:hypothetical protein